MSQLKTNQSTPINSDQVFQQDANGGLTPIVLQNQARSYKTVASGAASTVVSSSQGILASVNVCAGGTASSGVFNYFYDNATAPGSSPIFAIPGNAAAGTIYTVNIPVQNGIVSSGPALGPSLCVCYS